MNSNTRFLIAMAMTAVTAGLLVVASPLVPLGDQMPWMMGSVVALAVTAVCWIVAIQARSRDEEQSKTL